MTSDGPVRRSAARILPGLRAADGGGSTRGTDGVRVIRASRAGVDRVPGSGRAVPQAGVATPIGGAA